MAVTTAQRIRSRIQDIPRRADVVGFGDGMATTFDLDGRTNIQSGTAYVPLGGTAWSATGATFDPTGFVAFSNVISANSGYRTVYVYSTFSDAEIDDFITLGGSIAGASLEAVLTLQFDAIKRAHWVSESGAEYDDTAAQGVLKTLYDELQEIVDKEAVTAGGMESWSQNQELY